jgi:hypothetical protein
MKVDAGAAVAVPAAVVAALAAGAGALEVVAAGVAAVVAGAALVGVVAAATGAAEGAAGVLPLLLSWLQAASARRATHRIGRRFNMANLERENARTDDAGVKPAP